MKESEVIAALRIESEEFRQLEEEHKTLKATMNELNSKKYLTAEEEVQKKKVQKQKLYGKDRMAELIRNYKQ